MKKDHEEKEQKEMKKDWNLIDEIFMKHSLY